MLPVKIIYLDSHVKVRYKSSMSSKFYTTAEAARKIGVSRQTLQAWIAAKKVRAPKLRLLYGMGVRLWAESDLARLEKVKAKSRAGHLKKGKKV